MVLGTKAETLRSLQGALTCSTVPQIYFFTVCEWQANPESILAEIGQLFGADPVIVRSSALAEDQYGVAMAGAFLSIPDVNPLNSNELADAISAVVVSYDRADDRGAPDSFKDDENQILIQKLISSVSMSGVVFTQDLNTGAPYYVINYDDETGRTDTVASGLCNRTLLVLRGRESDLSSRRFQVLLKAVREIESVTRDDSLDIEFAVDEHNKVSIFQVRKITTAANWNRGTTLKVSDALRRVSECVEERLAPKPGVYGDKSILGRMPDWNPAEMIGTCPRPLAASLYRHLITDSSWRRARSEIGYASPAGMPLMLSLYGQPFIDVRLSFHSFIPKDLQEEIANKLVNAWLLNLESNPHLHDKIEFEVAITALDFDFENAVKRLIPGVLTQPETDSFKKSLHLLTAEMLSPDKRSVEVELDKIALLEKKSADYKITVGVDHLSSVRSILEECIELGTVPFSKLARYGFVAQSLLRSLESRGVLSASDIERFHGSFATITGELLSDLNALNNQKTSESVFYEKYGHLRPGTYDILSLRYDQRRGLFQALQPDLTEDKECQQFALSEGQRIAISELLGEYDYDISVEALFQFFAAAISGREYAKFVFTKSVSDALEHISAWGRAIRLSLDELSFLEIGDILSVQNTAKGGNLEEFLRGISQRNKEEYEVTKSLRLPHLICDATDLVIIPLLVDQPNFISKKSVKADCVEIQGAYNDAAAIDGKVVLIESADPGFDWIFTRPIAGLVTKFGGANSHMAIRCAEFNLPAAIGCGEQLYEQLTKCASVEIDCSECRIIPFTW